MSPQIDRIRSLGVVLLGALCIVGAQQGYGQAPQTLPLYIGTYTGGSSQGIYRSELNLESGQLSTPQLVAELTNPSFLAIHPRLNVLYAVSEVSQNAAAPVQQVMAYSIGGDGKLKSLGGQPSGGDGPCYISTDAAGHYAWVANYGSGSIAAFRLRDDGSLGELTCQIQHAGSSINPQRQQAPHAHCILSDPSDRYVCAVDLGIDQVLVYRLDRASGQLTPTGAPLKTEAGNGPRHLAFHPDGKHAFVIHELTSKLSSCSWDSQSGQLTTLDTLSTLPADFQGNNSTAEVLVHPNGKFVYGSNRGHDSIAIFAFQEDGSLIARGHVSSGGKTPRNFRLDPSGRYLLAENQGSDTIAVFRVDPQSGELRPVAEAVRVGSPCCIKFLSH